MKRKDRKQRHVVIIGAGMAGLTAGAYLAKAGYRVTVYEQAEAIGGVTTTLHQDGYAWDLGPLLLEGFAPDERAGRILRDLGLRVPLVRDDRAYVFPDFAIRKAEKLAGKDWRLQLLLRLFPAETEGLQEYWKLYNTMADLLALSVQADRAKWPKKWWLKLRMLRLYNRVKSWAKKSARDLMDDLFVDTRLKAVFTSILADFVTRPSDFPALGVPVLNFETAFDKRVPRKVSSAGKRPSYHYIAGGCENLVQAVANVIRDNDGRILTGMPVERIVLEGTHVTGVELANGHIENADAVIATGGYRETFVRMIGKPYLPSNFVEHLDGLQSMESVFMVQLGIDFDPGSYQPEALAYYYLNYDIETDIARCQSGHYHEGEDGFLIYIPSMHSSDMAPEGHHAVTIYTIAPNVNKDKDWAMGAAEYADKLVALAEKAIPGLKEHTKSRVILTPLEFQRRTHQKHHAFGGLSPVMNQSGPGYRTPLQNLWFIGSQSKSGGGVQNVMIGARDATRDMIHTLKRKNR